MALTRWFLQLLDRRNVRGTRLSIISLAMERNYQIINIDSFYTVDRFVVNILTTNQLGVKLIRRSRTSRPRRFAFNFPFHWSDVVQTTVNRRFHIG